MAEVSAEMAAVYGDVPLSFGPEFLIPKPFDTRLMLWLPPAVAKAAMDSGVATRPIKDLDAYRQSLSRFVYQTGLVMRPVFATAKAKAVKSRVIYAEGGSKTVWTDFKAQKSAPLPDWLRKLVE